MVLENIDFQPFIHQHISEKMDRWKMLNGFSDEQAQECASQLFNMGLVAVVEIQKEGVIKAQDVQQKIPYDEDLAKRVLKYFLEGMNIAVLKAEEEFLPGEIKWGLMQQVAYHIFETAKQMTVATLGQEATPEVQISDEQIMQWLTQTVTSALIHYITEYEKQYGEIPRTNLSQSMMDVAAAEQTFEEDVPALETLPVAEAEPVRRSPPKTKAVPTQVTATHVASADLPEIYHKYAAVALLLSSLPASQQGGILATFQPDEQHVIKQYQDPDKIAQELDLGLVAQYLKRFKEELGQWRPKTRKSSYSSEIAALLKTLPAGRLDRLFQQERPFVRGYVGQFSQTEQRRLDPYVLPTGVEESLLLYLERNFPKAAKQQNNEVTSG